MIILRNIISVLKVFVVSFAIMINFYASAQNAPFESVKKGNFVMVSGKFYYWDDNENMYPIKGFNWFFADEVKYDNDSIIKEVHLTDGKSINFTVSFEHNGGPNEYEYLSRHANFVVCDTCRYEGHYMTYINNDSTAFYSTHPSKPFKYGEVFNYKQSLEYKNHADFFDFQPGDKVASIGAASGWYEGMISVFTDSVSYTIQDIEKNILNKEELDGVVSWYSSIREKPQTNSFSFAIGDYTKTNLPQFEKYDIILLNNCYHHFSNKWKMMEDIMTYLKDDGQLILTGESFSSLYYTNYHGGCDIRAMQAKLVFDFYAKFGLYPIKMRYPVNALDNSIIFGRDKSASEKYLASLNHTNEIIKKIDRLNTSIYVDDDFYLTEMENELKGSLNEIHTTYDSLDSYLIDIAYTWMDRNRNDYAINILIMAEQLYLNNVNIQMSLGEAFLWNDDEETAMLYFQNAERLKPSYKKEIKEMIKAYHEWMGLPIEDLESSE